MSKPRVALLYLCWGCEGYLDDVVQSFKNMSYPKDRVTLIFIPNGSPDGITERIKNEVIPLSGNEFPEVVLIDDGENRGFAGGNNHGMKWALERDYDYVFLNNGDLYLDAKALDRLVDAAEEKKDAGSLQALTVYWHEPEMVNVSGGMIHVVGYGYARNNRDSLSDCTFDEVEEIAYASGAAVLYRASALRQVGLMEEGFFMYHEDLELGLRLLTAGYKNYLVSDAIAYHDYSFSRNPKKFAWMELYRHIVMLSYLKVPTLVLLSPIMLATEFATIVFSILGGWFPAKLWAYKEMFLPRNWKLLLHMRKRAKLLRTVSDRTLLSYMTGEINAQEESNWIVERVANPIISLWLRIIRKVMFW